MNKYAAEGKLDPGYPTEIQESDTQEILGYEVTVTEWSDNVWTVSICNNHNGKQDYIDDNLIEYYDYPDSSVIENYIRQILEDRALEEAWENRFGTWLDSITTTEGK